MNSTPTQDQLKKAELREYIENSYSYEDLLKLIYHFVNTNQFISLFFHQWVEGLGNEYMDNSIDLANDHKLICDYVEMVLHEEKRKVEEIDESNDDIPF